jgi:hypothetical protein
MADLTQTQSTAEIPLPTRPTTTTSTTLAPATQLYQQARDRVAVNQNVWTMTYSEHTPKYFFAIGLGSRPDTGTSTGVTPTGRTGVLGSNGFIFLPLPKGLEDTQQIEYSEYSLGPFWGNLADQNNTLLMQIQQQLREGQWAEATATGNRMTIEAGRSFGGLIAGGLNETRAANIGQTVGGIAINQFHTILLKGPTYKHHNLTFYLAPRNANESQMIRDIIVRLRQAAAPSISSTRIFWDFPEVAHCVFLPQGSSVKETYMYAFKPAVIEAVSARYDPGDSVAFYKDQGAPDSVVISIKLKEIEYWTREDYT